MDPSLIEYRNLTFWNRSKRVRRIITLTLTSLMIIVVTFICGVLTQKKEAQIIKWSASCPKFLSEQDVIERFEKFGQVSILSCYCNQAGISEETTLVANGVEYKCEEIALMKLKSDVLSYVFILIIFFSEEIYTRIIDKLVEFEKHTDLNLSQTPMSNKAVLFDMVCTGIMVLLLSMYPFNVFWGLASKWLFVGVFFQFTPLWF